MATMFDMFIQTHFAGGHHLRDYPGECEKPHGHNWKVYVTVRANELDKLGMGIDFKILKKLVNTTIDKLDHTNLNDLPIFETINPSSENVAICIFDDLNHDRYNLYSVTVFETDTSGLTYYGKNK